MSTEPQPATMSRADRAEQVALWRAIAEQAKTRADQCEAGFESAIGDEYRVEGAATTWRVKDLVTISGRTSNASARIADNGDFLAWMKAHRPEDVETIERVKPTAQSAILKGCHPDAGGTAVLTAAGDEIAGVEWVPGGTFQGVSFKFEPSAKAAWSEAARDLLDRLLLAPPDEVQNIAALPANIGAVDTNPWDVQPTDPWGASIADPWVSDRSGAA